MGSKAPYLVEQYVLDYPPPVLENINKIEASIKFTRFSVAHIYNNTYMNYKINPYKIRAYSYSKWRVNPGDLVSDYIIRDLRNANMFIAVMSYHEPENPRFIVEGGVEEFVELIEKDKSYAYIALSLVLVDNKEREITGKVVFQKKYYAKEPMQDHSPEAFARSISIALSRLSGQFMNDLYLATKKRMAH